MHSKNRYTEPEFCNVVQQTYDNLTGDTKRVLFLGKTMLTLVAIIGAMPDCTRSNYHVLRARSNEWSNIFAQLQEIRGVQQISYLDHDQSFVLASNPRLFLGRPREEHDAMDFRLSVPIGQLHNQRPPEIVEGGNQFDLKPFAESRWPGARTFDPTWILSPQLSAGAANA